jgi:beta-glucanase (GH16 family)
MTRYAAALTQGAAVLAAGLTLQTTLAAAPLPSTQTPATRAVLARPVTWGSPDQLYGKRRPVTDADRAAIQSYRAGRVGPTFATDFTDAAELARDWAFVSDDNTWGGFRSCRRPQNVESSHAGLRLKTLVATDCHLKWSTGFVVSKAKYGYGFFEATMKIADVKGMNNAFWMTTDDYPQTGDHFEIDVSEVQYPSYDHIGLQQYPAKGNKSIAHTGMGWGANFSTDLAAAFHDYGVLWTPDELIFAIDEEPVAAVVTHGAVHPPTNVAVSSALIYAGIPQHAEGHDMLVRSVRVFAYRK